MENKTSGYYSSSILHSMDQCHDHYTVNRDLVHLPGGSGPQLSLSEAAAWAGT